MSCACYTFHDVRSFPHQTTPWFILTAISGHQSHTLFIYLRYVFWHPAYVSHVFSAMILTTYLYVSGMLCFLVPCISHMCLLQPFSHPMNVSQTYLLTPYIYLTYVSCNHSHTLLHPNPSMRWSRAIMYVGCRNLVCIVLTPYLHSHTLFIPTVVAGHQIYRVSESHEDCIDTVFTIILTPYLYVSDMSSDTLYVYHVCFLQSFSHPLTPWFILAVVAGHEVYTILEFSLVLYSHVCNYSYTSFILTLVVGRYMCRVSKFN